MAVKASFSARNNARFEMAIRLERRKRQWWAYNRAPTPVRALHKLGTHSEGPCEDEQPKKEGKDRLVAVKIMENIADNVEEMEEEHRVLRDLCVHPNIPTYFGIFFQPAPCREDDQVWFVMELCTGGSVTDLVQNLRKTGSRLPEPIIAYILRETIDALRFLHTHHCMHRDVKGHNILLTDTGTVKLVDFGECAVSWWTTRMTLSLPANREKRCDELQTPHC
ncbi:hypothetical protein HPB48_013905 [Haemaphysalis longicornis]|uniref:Protein kinase domain-containing protein n=1 Tax=Haemaphysalis longicornis TaxID=44386 RepID=A0A9J6G630_HAELO|nr:hypothetical protein HPB48_013905 [Haemaphysalis longicornis]